MRMNRINVIHAFYKGNDTHEIIINHTEKLDTFSIYVEDNGYHKLYEGTDSNFVIKYEYNQTHRLKFKLEMNDDSLEFYHRIVPIKGMYNFRDIGGYLTESGKRIKWGKIYRGDHLFNLESDQDPLLEEIGINSIIDLRSSREINDSPNPYIGQIRSVYCDPNAHIAAFAGLIQDADKGLSIENILDNPDIDMTHITQTQAEKQMIQQQHDFVNTESGKTAFKRVLETMLLEDSAPSYQHCRGGKDRTGYSIMLIMAALGVKKDLLVEDYLLTKKAREEKNAVYLEEFKKLAGDNEEVVSYLYTFFDTKESFIQGAFNALESYGGLEKYLENEMKLNKNDILNLREKYLEG